MDIELSQIVVKVPGADRSLFEIDSLKIPSGAHVLIEGASGRGKSTFLHLIAGLLAPDRGEIRIGGGAFSRLTERERARFRRKSMAFIFQRLNLLDHLTAEENVLLGMQNPDRAQARRSLEEAGLAGRHEALSSVLSLGEQQRVAIARLLATPGTILLADEPTSSLDEVNTELVLGAILRAAKGKTLIIVSHDKRIQEKFATRLAFENWVKK